jgi:hypothetical protein
MKAATQALRSFVWARPRLDHPRPPNSSNLPAKSRSTDVPADVGSSARKEAGAASHTMRSSTRGCGLLALLLLLGCYDGLPRTTAGADGTGTDGPDPTAGDETADTSEDENPLPLQPLHRLNRLEYDNTVRDLLGTTRRPSAAFGPDAEANGFDNMAAQLGLSPVLLDAYAKAAHDVIADGIDERPVFTARFASHELGVAGGYPVGNLWALTGNAASVAFEVPQDGAHELVLTAGASTIGPAPVPTAALELDGQLVASFTVEGSGAAPVDHVHPIALAPGPHTLRVLPTNWVNDAVANTSNNVLVAALTVRSVATTLGPGRNLVYVCDPAAAADPEACYETIIARFAFRAWRRPLTADEETSLLKLWATVRSHGESNDDALRIVMRAVMTSPKFFYRMRTTADADDGEWLDDYVLASRLSYFLWSSMPDDRLFEMANERRLATDEGLSEAVRFMLADDKARALLDGFAEQWLSSRHLASASPSPEVFPGFDDAVREAMAQESKLFFGDFLQSGAPVASMVLPEFAHRNDTLAAHYGLPPVGSAELVRVPATGPDRRGMLSLGAWLAVHSDADHSSPIRRGRWVSDRLLCAPVPPPPPGLEIEPVELGGDESVREQLEKHRSDPTCAACHSLLDVLGIGFEEYDAVARLRVGEVDNLGELPDGRAFAGAAELAGLYADSEVFVGCLTRKLYTYAVGRAPVLVDASYIDEVSTRVHADGGDLVALIDAIVHTPAFRSPAPLEE